jgi:hypothetical protein
MNLREKELKAIKRNLNAFKEMSRKLSGWIKPIVTTDKKKKANKNECRKWKM